MVFGDITMVFANDIIVFADIAYTLCNRVKDNCVTTSHGLIFLLLTTEQQESRLLVRMRHFLKAQWVLFEATSDVHCIRNHGEQYVFERTSV